MAQDLSQAWAGHNARLTGLTQDNATLPRLLPHQTGKDEQRVFVIFPGMPSPEQFINVLNPETRSLKPSATTRTITSTRMMMGDSPSTFNLQPSTLVLNPEPRTPAEYSRACGLNPEPRTLATRTGTSTSTITSTRGISLSTLNLPPSTLILATDHQSLITDDGSPITEITGN